MIEKRNGKDVEEERMNQEEAIGKLSGYTYRIPEGVERNPALFYVERAGCGSYDADFEIVRDHTYPFYTLHFLFNGCGFFRIRGQDYFLTKGEAFLITPGEEHVYCNFTAASIGLIWVEASGILCGDVLMELNRKGLCVFRRGSTGKVLDSLIDLVEYLKEQAEVNDYEVSAKVYGLFMNLMDGALGKVQEKKPELFLKALEYIHGQTDKNLRVGEVAEELHISTAYLNKLFHANAGISPIKYITWKRVERACAMLRETRLTADKISEELGFYDSAYFVKVFKSAMGMTPMQYRTVNGEEKEETEQTCI